MKLYIIIVTLSAIFFLPAQKISEFWVKNHKKANDALNIWAQDYTSIFFPFLHTETTSVTSSLVLWVMKFFKKKGLFLKAGIGSNDRICSMEANSIQRES